jgi:hypothetical protein
VSSDVKSHLFVSSKFMFHMLDVKKTKEPVDIFALNFCISNADCCLQFSCYFNSTSYHVVGHCLLVLKSLFILNYGLSAF